MIGKMKYFIRRPWSTQLTLNNRKQIRYHKHLSQLIKAFAQPDSVVCDAMCWMDTPQNYGYWARIVRDDNHY